MIGLENILLLIFKVIVVLLMGLYFLFAVVLTQKTRYMRKVLRTKGGGLLFGLTVANLLVTLILIVFVIIS